MKSMENDFEKNVRALYGKEGAIWLKNLPQLVDVYAKKWSLHDLVPFKNLSYAYVLSGKRGNQPIVLKISPGSLQKELLALKAFDGHGCVQVLERDEKVLLLQQALPGTSLKNLFPHDDRLSVEVVFSLIRKLHAAALPQSGLFPHIKDWLKVLDQSWDLPISFLLKARLCRNVLLERNVQEVLLHADLHHDNVLKQGKSWCAIDPKGAIGDPLYEVAAFIRNPLDQLPCYKDRSSLIQSRIFSFADLFAVNPSLIAQWCFVESVLSWIWCLQDATPATSFEVLTPLFDALSQEIQ